jgi:hypothetical protein
MPFDQEVVGGTCPRAAIRSPTHPKESLHRGSTDGQPSGHRRCAEACGRGLPRSIGVMRDGRRPPMPHPTFPGLCNAGFHPFAPHLTLELSNDCQHPGQRPARGCGDISRVMPRKNAHAQRLPLVECAHQVRSGPISAV